MPPLPRPPILLEPAVGDPAELRALVERLAPYWPVQRYFGSGAEYAALSGDEGGAAMPVAPVFRGNWATEGKALPGVEPLLHHPPFVEAARRLFDAELVRPLNVYVNLTWQLPFPQGAGHTDVPAFRGLDRTRYPIAWLTLMGLSGLFEDVRVKIATAVAWFYRGSDGGFEYWPEGPERPPRVHEGAIENTAVVGDNDFMWHRVRPTGLLRDGMARLRLESELVREGDTWAIRDGERRLARFGWDALRVSLSWKAVAFASEADRRRHDEHRDDIDLAEVLRRFGEDLGRRGVEIAWPADPVRDAATIRRLRDAYVRYPAGAPPS
jgi:hypothetical protein